MPSIEISARTIAEATRLALEQLGVDEDEAIIEVLQSGDEENEALVRVSTLDAGEAPLRRAPFDPEAAAREGRRILEGILRHMEVDGFVNVQHTTAVGPAGETQHSIMLYVEGLDEETVGLLIGRRGETLRSLQFLVNTIVQRHLGRWPQIVIDIGNYRQRRQESLEGLARRVAEQVRATGQPQPLDPMQAYDRRIIHMALRDDATVYTESAGEGENRHVVIYPRK